MSMVRRNYVALVAAACLVSGCADTGKNAAVELGKSLVTSADKLKEAADKIDPVAIKLLLEELKQERSRNDKLIQQIQGLELERKDLVPKEVIGHYKNVHDKSTKVEHVVGAEFKFIGEQSIYTYHFDPKKVVFVCDEVKGAEAYYFPGQGVLAFSGCGGERPTFWSK